LQELHRDIGDIVALAHVENGDDVRMAQTARRLGFLIEARLVLFFFIQRQVQGNGLDRDDTINQRSFAL